MGYPPTLEEYNELINKVKLLEQKNEQKKNDDTMQKTMKGKKKASKFTKVDMELESMPKEERKNIRHLNSLAEAFHNNTRLRKSLKFLGEDLAMDEWLDWRVKWGQRGVGGFGFFTILFFILSGGTNVGLLIATIIFAVLGFICYGMIYYKNLSFVIIKRLLKETNVKIIIILSLSNWSITIARPMTPLSPILGFIYMVCVNTFVFIDAMKLKSRIFVIIIGTLATVLNIYNIYGYTFGNWHKGAVLLDYTIQGEENSIMMRSTQRSIFIEILFFSMTAVYTMFKDKKMDFMIFATGNIYRETGTASKEIEDKTYSMSIREERRRSTNQIQPAI